MIKREVLHIKGSEHQNPIPTAVKIGNMVYTSALIGSDPDTGEIPEDVNKEIRNLFYYVEEIMKAAGGLPTILHTLASIWLIENIRKMSILNG